MSEFWDMSGWTPCEAYGHRYAYSTDPAGFFYGSCVDCDEECVEDA